MTKKLFLSIIILGAFFVFSGCSISLKGKETSDLGGLFISGNRGDAWERKNAIPTSSGNGSIGSLDCSSFALDPSDNNALYFGSVDNGLYFSYDNAGSWQKAGRLENIIINSIAIDTKDKCNIYIASANKIYKSEDCSRNWKVVYYDNDPSALLSNIVIDHYNPNIIFIATDRGDVIKSVNKGESWQTIQRFDDKIKKMAIHQADSRIIFVGTEKKGVYRSMDNGDTWVDLSEKLSKFEKKITLRDLAVTPVNPNYVILATVYGLFDSTDNGDTWEKINLITPEKEAVINSVAISPKNEKAVYYVTDTTFYRSIDGGDNWTTVKLPTSRTGRKVAVNAGNDSVVYMCALTVKK